MYVDPSQTLRGRLLIRPRDTHYFKLLGIGTLEHSVLFNINPLKLRINFSKALNDFIIMVLYCVKEIDNERI